MTPEEQEAAGIRTPYPTFWVWVLCWPLALWVTLATAWRNAKTTHDGS